MARFSARALARLGRIKPARPTPRRAREEDSGMALIILCSPDKEV